MPRCVTGMPAACGHRDDAGEPRNDVHRDPRGQARGDLLAAAAVDERVAALEADDAQAAPRALDEDLVDLVLRHGVVSGALSDVDDLDVGSELAEHAGGAEAVGHDDVGLGEQRAGRAR